MKNPQLEIITSVISELFSNHRLDIVGPFPAEYLADFQLSATRSPRPLPQFTPPPKNVLVIVMESTGARYMSLYGSPYDTTPRLLAESQHALVFDHFYAHIGYSFCAMMPIIYSVYPGPPWLISLGLPRPPIGKAPASSAMTTPAAPICRPTVREFSLV